MLWSMRSLPLHWKILIGMFLGIVAGLLAAIAGANLLVSHYIKPFGTIFINLLKLIAIPLIIVSLIKGIGELKDISRLSRMGGRTIGLYMATTLVAVLLGLMLVNVIKPGKSIGEQTRKELLEGYSGEAATRIALAESQKEQGPLQPLIDLIPGNIFSAMSDNTKMLQVIFFVIFFAIGLILIEPAKAQPILSFVDGLNEVVMKMIDLVMLSAPYGVFALMASLVVESPSWGLFKALMWYAVTVLSGLFILIGVFYPALAYLFTGFKYRNFFAGIAPAQLVAFSTSSSAATLPVTMERVSEHMGVDEEVTSFVLPVGATINMDGTSLYQAVAAVFIAQAFGIDLSLSAQMTIVLTAMLASIGSAAVPSAGMIMLVIVLGAAGIPEAGLALIFAVDRPLDMFRTVTNITGDATVSLMVGKSLGLLKEPSVRTIKDHYKTDA